MITALSAVQVAAHTVSRPVGNTVVVLDARTGRYYRLDGSAGEIWSLLPDCPTVGDLVDRLANRYGRATTALDDEVSSFVQSAIDDGLLETADSPSRDQSNVKSPVLIERNRLVVHAPEALKALFDQQHYVHLPHMIEPSLLSLIARLVNEGEFVHRTHHGIGTELCLVPGIATSVLQLLFNDPALRAFAASMAGDDAIGCYDGRVYRMSPVEGHYDSWHSDMGEDRRIALSLNLSPDGYDGGELEIRRTSSETAEWTVKSSGYGSAVMFRIAPTLRHRVNAVRGTRPRTAWAGWFRSVPVFEELFLPTLRQS
jgi:hypothetical protein